MCFAKEYRKRAENTGDFCGNREQIKKLAEIYSKNVHDACIVATICDEVLDKSGALLGEVRKIARNYVLQKKH